MQRNKNFLSFQILSFESYISLSTGKFTSSLTQSRVINRRINFCDKLTFLYWRVEISMQDDDFTGNLTADIYADQGA